MKSLVVYDSAFGNTKAIAEKISDTIGGRLVKASEFKRPDLDGIEFLIVGSPINGWKPLPAIADFLSSLKPEDLNNIKATSFDTRVKLFIHGDAKNKIANELKMAGADIFIRPEAFYVKGSNGPLFDGEVEKAAKWAKSMI